MQADGHVPQVREQVDAQVTARAHDRVVGGGPIARFGRPEERPVPRPTTGAAGGGNERGRLKIREGTTPDDGQGTQTSKPLGNQGLRSPEGSRERRRKEASPGFEPGVTVLQTVALPLGDEAVPTV